MGTGSTLVLEMDVLNWEVKFDYGVRRKVDILPLLPFPFGCRIVLEEEKQP